VIRLALLATFPVLFALMMGSAQESPIPTVTIAGGSLPHDVRLAPADADAFRRRINQPPRLEDGPRVTEEPYLVTTSYWASAVRLEEGEGFFDVGVQGDYYPERGYVRVEVDEDDVWMVLDLRQRAILDRYIRLGEAGALGEAPSTLDVLAAAADSETLTVTAGGEVVAGDAIAGLLLSLVTANPAPFVEEPAAPTADGEGFWLIVDLLEGRTLRYFYDGAALTEALGTERYDASSVTQTLTSLQPASLPTIEQDEPAGSAAWWVVMVGGGVVALAVAVWWQRRRHRRARQATRA
jgi:hypothetical protein